MKKIIALIALALFVLVSVSPAHAQKRKVYRIAILAAGRPGPSPIIDALRQGLRDLGYIEGQNIIIEYRYAERRYDRLPRLAAEVVRLKPDVIVTSTTPGVRAAKRATKSIPIVVGAAGGLVRKGFVKSLSRPGGNITGLTFHSQSELNNIQLEILKEAVPKISRVALLLNPDNTSGDPILKLRDVSRALGVQILRVDARGANEFEAAFSAMTKGGADALLMANDLVFNQNRKRIAELALKHHLPTIAQRPVFAEAGGLMSYGSSIQDMWRRAATMVDKILKGTKPADIPVERPKKFNGN